MELFEEIIAEEQAQDPQAFQQEISQFETGSNLWANASRSRSGPRRFQAKICRTKHDLDVKLFIYGHILGPNTYFEDVTSLHLFIVILGLFDMFQLIVKRKLEERKIGKKTNLVK